MATDYIIFLLTFFTSFLCWFFNSFALAWRKCVTVFVKWLFPWISLPFTFRFRWQLWAAILSIISFLCKYKFRIFSNYSDDDVKMGQHFTSFANNMQKDINETLAVVSCSIHSVSRRSWSRGKLEQENHKRMRWNYATQLFHEYIFLFDSNGICSGAFRYASILNSAASSFFCPGKVQTQTDIRRDIEAQLPFKVLTFTCGWNCCGFCVYGERSARGFCHCAKGRWVASVNLMIRQTTVEKWFFKVLI